MRRLLAIARKETIHIVRDKRSLIAALGLPVILLLLYGFAVDFDLKDLPFATVDYDRTPSSRRLIDAVASTAGFRYVEELATPQEADPEFQARRVLAVVVVPRGFEESLKARDTAPLQVLIDGADGSTASVAVAYMTGAVTAAGQSLIRRELRAQGVPLALVKPGFEVRTRVLYNPDLKSRLFLVPGLVGVILMMLAALLTSGTVVRERERGSFELLAASPVSSAELMLGKLLPYLVLATFDVVLTVVLGWAFFGVVPQGSLVLLFSLSLIYVLSALALGLLFSCVARTQQTAMQLAIVATVVPTMTLSGFAFPVRNMPVILQALAQVLPATHFMVIARAIILKGVGLREIWPSAVALAIISAFLMRAAVKRFRKTL